MNEERIIFRNITSNAHPCLTPELQWQVEFYGSRYRGFPVGLAWVNVPPAQANMAPYIAFVLVEDQERRRRIATKLIQACRDAWPNLWLTDGVTVAGKALLASLDQGEAVGARQSEGGQEAEGDMSEHR